MNNVTKEQIQQMMDQVTQKEALVERLQEHPKIAQIKELIKIQEEGTFLLNVINNETAVIKDLKQKIITFTNQYKQAQQQEQVQQQEAPKEEPVKEQVPEEMFQSKKEDIGIDEELDGLPNLEDLEVLDDKDN